MQKRTEEEVKAIVRKCVELEKAGGDVLGYLSSQHYVTPRATWYRFQREYLDRPASKMTEGRPKKAPAAVAKAEKIEKPREQHITKPEEEKHMEKGHHVGKERTDIYRTAANIAIQGISPMKYLQAMGYACPAQEWNRVKKWAEKNEPELFAKIPKTIKGLKQPREDGTVLAKVPRKDKPDVPQATKDEKPQEQKKAITEKPEKKDQEKAMERKIAEQTSKPPKSPEQPKEEPNEEQKAEPEQKQQEQSPLRICGIAGTLGEWHIYRNGQGGLMVCFTRKLDSGSTGIIELTVEDWATFLGESKAAIEGLVSCNGGNA